MAKTPATPADAAAHPDLWAALQTFEDSLQARDAAKAARVAAAAQVDAVNAALAAATAAEATADQKLRDDLTALGNVAAALVVPPAAPPA